MLFSDFIHQSPVSKEDYDCVCLYSTVEAYTRIIIKT